MSHEMVEFSESLSDSDYGLIIGKDGTLKGIWIPKGKEDDEIPDEIASICISKFGIDPNDGSEVVLQ